MEQQNILPQAEVTAQAEHIRAVRAQTDAMTAQTGVRPRAFVLTFGCQQNEADSEKLRGLAREMGYDITDTPEDASLIAVNTCAIREHAEKRALSIIGQYKHLKERNPALIIAVCGCMTAQEHRAEQLKKSYPYVDIVFGTASIHRFPEFVAGRIAGSRRRFCPTEEKNLVAEGLPILRENSYRAWVSIMYGCNNFCSYCIVPYVRGRERSRTLEAVREEVAGLVADGYREITLLGQNVNSYGKDAGYPYDFADLLAELDRIPGDYVLRFMTSHPKDASRKLIDVMADSVHVAHQFHLPMQSGSDRILRVMNRHYDTAQYLATVDYLRARIPDITLTSDIIVGFPGEHEEDFAGTLEMLRRVRFDMLYSFIYSPRKGTPAAEMPDQIPKPIQQERFDRLLALQTEIGAEKNAALVGQTLRVLCDGVSKTNPDLYSGRTDGYKIAFFPGDARDVGRFIPVRITRADAFALWGERAD